MKFWVTRHALTNGIYQVDAPNPPKKGLVEVNCLETGFKVQYLRYGIECFEDRSKAVESAERMRNARISAYQGQIERLKGLEFK